MRLLEVRLLRDPEDSETLYARFSVGGAQARLSLEVPGPWDGWTRAEKMAWVKQEIAAHLETTTYLVRGVVFPDQDAPESAKDGFEGLPGWATWTADQAAQWIEDNVTDLATAKATLKRMARAVVHLRDVVIER